MQNAAAINGKQALTFSAARPDGMSTAFNPGESTKVIVAQADDDGLNKNLLSNAEQLFYVANSKKLNSVIPSVR